MTREPAVRRVVLVAMIVVVGLLLVRDDGSDEAFTPVTGPAVADAEPAAAPDPCERLGPRVERYLALRRADDWPALYELTDPEQRASVPLGRFLEFFGHGVLTVDRIETGAVRCDPERGVAAVDVHTEARLVPARLPPRFRTGLRIESEADLLRSTDHTQPWVLRDGEWYYLMDAEFVRGVDTQGQPVSAVDAAQG